MTLRYRSMSASIHSIQFSAYVRTMYCVIAVRVCSVCYKIHVIYTCDYIFALYVIHTILFSYNILYIL